MEPAETSPIPPLIHNMVAPILVDAAEAFCPVTPTMTISGLSSSASLFVPFVLAPLPTTTKLSSFKPLLLLPLPAAKPGLSLLLLPTTVLASAAVHDSVQCKMEGLEKHEGFKLPGDPQNIFEVLMRGLNPVQQTWWSKDCAW